LGTTSFFARITFPVRPITGRGFLSLLHLTFVTDVGLHELADNFGNDHAQAAWDAGAAAIDEIERIVQEEEIQCEITRAPGYLHACVNTVSEEEISSLKKEARLAAKLGFGATYLERVPYFGAPGVLFPNQAKFHPRKYLRSLVMKLSGNGSHVFEKSAATEFDAKKRRTKVNGLWIGFDRVVMATNNPLIGLASITSATLFQTKLSLYTSYVIGYTSGLRAFTAAVLGGIGNIPGAMLGGVVTGLIESLGGQYIAVRWTDVIIFSLLVLVLVLRPSGLLGRAAPTKS